MGAQGKIRTLSLFSGAGGLDIGFTQAGFDIAACVEIEPAYCKTLDANHGKGLHFSAKAKIHCGDIREFDPTPFVDMGIECIIGGPPCQTFSAAGRRSGGVLGTSDARGRLFESYCRVLDIIQPRAFLFENVYGLPGANGGKAWREICEAFSSRGFSLSAEVLDSADYGVPQHRERLIIVGVRRGEREFRFPEPTHGPDSSSGEDLVSVWTAIKDLQKTNEPFHEFDGLYGHLLSQVPEGLNYSFFTQEMGYPQPRFAWRSKFHDFLYKVDRHSPARTIKAQPGKFTGPFHWKNRHFTIPELKRLQSFPDEYEIVGSFGKVMEQIGNSVPPLLGEILATSLREQVLDAKKQQTYAIRPVGFKSSFRQRQRERTIHFKKVAQQEVLKRFPNVEVMRPRSKRTSSEYLVSFEGLFVKTVRKRVDPSLMCEATYLVVQEREGSEIRVDARKALKGITPSTNIRIKIDGLRKYLVSVDSLVCNAQLGVTGDLFKVWDIIEDALTTDSQFFTLIDIYGHYANRGDTVRVSVSFDRNKLSVIERAIEFFGDSANCGIFFDDSFIAAQLGIEESKVPELIHELRSLRWDVRTSATHATISQHGLLCTYPFPILSGKAQFERGNMLVG